MVRPTRDRRPSLHGDRTSPAFCFLFFSLSSFSAPIRIPQLPIFLLADHSAGIVGDGGDTEKNPGRSATLRHSRVSYLRDRPPYPNWLLPTRLGKTVAPAAGGAGDTDAELKGSPAAVAVAAPRTAFPRPLSSKSTLLPIPYLTRPARPPSNPFPLYPSRWGKIKGVAVAVAVAVLVAPSAEITAAVSDRHGPLLARPA